MANAPVTRAPAMEKRNTDTAKLTAAGFAEGVDYFTTGPHGNGVIDKAGHERTYMNYHCMTCVYSHPYPDRMAEHLSSGLHVHRERTDSENATPPPAPAKAVESKHEDVPAVMKPKDNKEVVK